MVDYFQRRIRPPVILSVFLVNYTRRYFISEFGNTQWYKYEGIALISSYKINGT
jgi:hypothetical protein